MSNSFPLGSHISNKYQAVKLKVKGPQPLQNTEGQIQSRGRELSDFLNRDEQRSGARMGIQTSPSFAQSTGQTQFHPQDISLDWLEAQSLPYMLPGLCPRKKILSLNKISTS